MPAPKRNKNARLDPDANADRSLMIRVKNSDLERWRKAAAAAGYRTLSPWVRHVLDSGGKIPGP